MPTWVLPLLSGTGLIAFLYFAFWRGLRNKPEDRPDNWRDYWTGHDGPGPGHH